MGGYSPTTNARSVRSVERAREGTAGRLKNTARSTYHIDTSEQPLPGPAEPTLCPSPTTRKTHRSGTLVTAA